VYISEFAMDTSPDAEALQGQMSELSSEELEAISGGQVNVSFTLMMAEDSSAFVAEEGGGRSSVSGMRRRSFFGWQINGTFESMDHFSSFFSKITSFFGRR
jgi:hypothetical protein